MFVCVQERERKRERERESGRQTDIDRAADRARCGQTDKFSPTVKPTPAVWV